MKDRKWFTLWVMTLLAVLLVSACTGKSLSGAPAISIAPTAGGADTLVAINGVGFPVGAALNVRLGPPSVGATPQSYGQAVADGRGEFRMSFTMPAQWPDGRPITEKDLVIVVINEDGSVKATAPFTFESRVGGPPALALKPENAGPGQQIEVIGYYFRAGTQIGLRLGAPNTGLGDQNLMEVQVDECGTFEVTLTIPDRWPGSGAPFSERELVIGAVDKSMGQALATASFVNTKSAESIETAVGQPETGGVKAFFSEEGDFSLLLPRSWDVVGPTSTELGRQYLLGPAPVSGGQGPGNSRLVIADAALPPEKAVKRLCDGCTPDPTLQETIVNGRDAMVADMGGAGTPDLEWFLVENEGKLIIFSIHDPETLESLDGVIQSFSPGTVPVGPAAVPAAQMARQELAAQLDVDPYTIVIASAESAEWPDACLGLPDEQEVCAQSVTPGYAGMLQTQNAQYEYHADETGSAVRLVPGAALSAQQVLAQQLRTYPEAIAILNVEPVEWADACLGVPAAGEVCAQVLTPGYRIVLEAVEQRYEVHTDETGTLMRLASAPQPEIADAAVVWIEERNEECQTAILGPDTVVFGLCGGPLMNGQYAVAERAEALTYYVETYAPFEAATSAGQVQFTGRGTTPASPAEQRVIAEWARLTALEAAMGRSGASYGLVLAWHRAGGIAGFCDDLTIYVTGDVFASSCRGEQPQNLGHGRLTAEQLQQLYAWTDELRSFELDETDPATADALTIRVVFSGTGGAEAMDSDRQAIQEWAARLFEGFNQ